MTGGRPEDARQYTASRVVLVALLTGLVLAGLRGVTSAPRLNGPYHGDGVAIGGILEGVLAALLVATVIRGRRAAQGAFVAARLRGVLRSVLVAGLIAIPVTLLFDSPVRSHPLPHAVRPAPRPSLSPGKLPTPSPTPRSGPPGHFPWPTLIYALLALVLLAAAAITARVTSRRRGQLAAVLGPRVDDDEEASLRDAVESGRIALRELDDARTAIIACYLAMEESLAREGAARAAADTPGELLARAAAAGLIRGRAAATLTALFYEARFSSHPLGTAQRDAAAGALAGLAADLGRPVAARDGGGVTGASP